MEYHFKATIKWETTQKRVARAIGMAIHQKADLKKSHLGIQTISTYHFKNPIKRTKMENSKLTIFKLIKNYFQTNYFNYFHQIYLIIMEKETVPHLRKTTLNANLKIGKYNNNTILTQGKYHFRTPIKRKKIEN